MGLAFDLGGTFTYFIEQGAFAMAPWVLVLPLVFMGGVARSAEANRVRSTLAIASGFCFVLFTLSATRFHHYVLPVLPGVAVLVAFALDELLDRGLAWGRVALTLGGVGAGLVWKDLWQRPRHLLDLFTFNQDRPYPDQVLLAPVNFKVALAASLGILALVLAVAALRKNARLFVGGVLGFAGACAVFLSWQHWAAMGKHWTQRSLIDHYYAARAGQEPLGAFLMNWKGETLYTRNEVLQISTRDPRGELQNLVGQPGRAFAVVEHARLPMLQASLPPGQRVQPLAPETTNKFVLVRIDDP